MTKTFKHDGKLFEIREAVLNDRYSVKVFLDNELVSPEYSVTIEIGQDYFAQHGKRLINELARIAEEDIRNGIYYTT